LSGKDLARIVEGLREKAGRLRRSWKPIVDEIEGVVHEATERELTTTEIGEMIMHR